MKTEIEIIEHSLEKRMDAEETVIFNARSNDPAFRLNLLAQAKVHMAALLYGRRRRRAAILAAGETAFRDPSFRAVITAIFK